MKNICLLALPLLFAFSLSAQSPTQTLRGLVADADSGAPLPGANLALFGKDTLRAFADENGRYAFPAVPIGRYRLQASFVGYETLVIAEVLVEAGKETVLNVQLRARGQALEEVVVKAQSSGGGIQALGAYAMTAEDQLRFPASFFDPGRVAMSYPGVAGVNDGTNIVSVRGNSPQALKWRLEGVEIVNPNHTANAGTFSDRPTQAGGGVNILSAQALGASQFMSGAFSAEYGNSLGGILDMRLRRGNDQKHEFTAQAGLIGIDLAAEGPIGKNGASFLANYRYSFTGLLAGLGVDFGGEEIGFQDAYFHLNLPAGKAGQFSLFGLGGKSYTYFNPPADTTEIVEDKQRFDIDFQSQMGALGLTHDITLGKKGALRTAIVLSALEHERSSQLLWRTPEPLRWDDDLSRERKLALSSVYTVRIGQGARLKAGLQASQEYAQFASSFGGIAFFAGEISGWLLQPFFDWQLRIAPRLSLDAGLRMSHFTWHTSDPSWEPRAVLSYATGARGRLSVSYEALSQTLAPELYAGGADDFIRSHRVSGGYRHAFSPSLIFNAEVYYQRLLGVPISGAFSAINMVEAFRQEAITLTPEGTGRNSGIDMALQKFMQKNYYFIASGSLYRSLYALAEGVDIPSRFDGRYVFNLTAGREFEKRKENKTLVRGVNVRLLSMGGFRAAPVDVEASLAKGATVYDESGGYPLRQRDYFRADLRLYLKWNRAGRNSMLSLDVQNALNRRNDGFDYFDFVQGNVQSKRQLGLIPIMSWRVEF